MDRKDIEKKVADAKHQSKPEDKNTIVFYDKDGNWIFELYTVGHEVKKNGVD